MKKYLYVVLCFINIAAFAQEIKLKKRKPNALTGSEFAKSIADTSLSLVDREKRIYQEIKMVTSLTF